MQALLNLGNFVFTPEVFGGPNDYHYGDPQLADLDGDGFLDVYCRADFNRRPSWRRNLGNGTFGPDQAFAPSMLFNSFLAFDVDGDLDLDMIVDGFAGGLLRVFENLHTLETTYCPATANSVGAGAELTATGNRLASTNQIAVQGIALPPGQIVMLLNSPTRGQWSLPANSGTLCLGAGWGRYNRPGEIAPASAAGTFSLVLDLLDTPDQTVNTMILAGETWNFQAWYRDLNPAPETNFTNAIEIRFE